MTLNPRDAATQRTLMEAIRLHGAGRYDEAIRLLETDSRALKSATGQNMAGDILIKQGKHREAVRAFDVAIKLAPAAPEPHANRGVALQEMGRLEEALAAEDRALRLRPRYATAHFNRGNILKALNRFDEAVTAYDRAIQAQPGFAEAILNRGLALLRLDRPMEALVEFGRALNANPRYVAAHVGRAGAFRELGRGSDGLAALDAALALEPGNLEAEHLRCNLLLGEERFEEALAAADTLIDRDPDDEIGHKSRAAALTKLKRFDEALAAADTAIRLAPKYDEAHTARAIALGEMGRLAESLAALEEARQHGASGKDYHHARAVALTTLGDPDEALAEFDKVLGIDPNFTLAHINRGYLRLMRGDWKGGWEDHEWRIKVGAHKHNEFVHSAPKWAGEDVAGKRLFVYAEQGFGDSIQFVRYLPLLRDRGATLTLAVPEPVRRLFIDNFPYVDVTDVIGARTGFDFQVSLMSLPQAFATTPDSVPQNVPYLAADAERAAKWRQRLGGEGFRVGIAWQGNPKYGRDRDRSIRVAEFAPLAAVPGVRLISLQTAAGEGQLKSLSEGMKVETLGEEIVNNPDGFREMAAVMANLDLLITSDTGPAHLGGALGRPVWVALTRYPDWRWMRDRDDSPWYPTMRLYRQATTGDWPAVFARLAADLAKAAAGK